MSTLRVNNIQTTAGINNLGRILQVIKTVKSDVFTASNADGTFQDVTGMSASITPVSTNSRILVMVNIGKHAGINNNAFRILRSGTAWDVGVEDGVRPRINFSESNQGRDVNHTGNISWSSVDSPNTTSTITYQLQVMPENTSSTTFRLNRSWANTNGIQGYNGSAASTVILMEISV
jgi:hypothetical protein